MSELQKKILDPLYYEKEIEKLHQKLIFQDKLFFSETDDISYSAISYGRKYIAKLLVKEVKNRNFKPKPGTAYTSLINGKKRELFKFDVLTRIMHGVIARILAEELSKKLCAQVYSYRIDKSIHDAVRKFAGYVRQYKKKHTDIRSRGLYVLRQDIESYTDSIQAGSTAPVWEKLRTLSGLKKGAGPFEDYLWELLQSIVRPELEASEGVLYTKLIGVPTGSPISALLYNLCGDELDNLCSSVEGGFYARYSDDFVFAHHDALVTERVENEIKNVLERQGLRINAEKSKNLYFNAAGRPSPYWEKARGCSAVEYLGARINFSGEVALSKKRTRSFLRMIRRRIQRTSKISNEKQPEIKANLICDVVNAALSPLAKSCASNKAARYILESSTDRTFLKQMDHLIALMISEELSGKTGPMAFRQMEPKKLHENLGLHSLYHNRNLARKPL